MSIKNNLGWKVRYQVHGKVWDQVNLKTIEKLWDKLVNQVREKTRDPILQNIEEAVGK
jgi:hypothetical protein